MNSAALTIPRSRTGTANSFGMLTSSSAYPKARCRRQMQERYPQDLPPGPKAR